jgi:hypothetical protein
MDHLSWKTKKNIRTMGTNWRFSSQGSAEQILAERVAGQNRDDHKARDAGRSWDYDAKERNAMSERFYRNPDGTGLCRRSALSGS